MTDELRSGLVSGFVSLVGRPNVGKSTLVNTIVGSKVAITSSRPQTTRTTVRGVRTTGTSQIVLLDTPGLHKPRTALGERTNERARNTLAEANAALGEALGVSRQTVNSIETGKYDPSLPLAFAIAALFETSIEEIFHVD